CRVFLNETHRYPFPQLAGDGADEAAVPDCAVGVAAAVCHTDVDNGAAADEPCRGVEAFRPMLVMAPFSIGYAVLAQRHDAVRNRHALSCINERGAARHDCHCLDQAAVLRRSAAVYLDAFPAGAHVFMPSPHAAD